MVTAQETTGKWHPKVSYDPGFCFSRLTIMRRQYSLPAFGKVKGSLRKPTPMSEVSKCPSCQREVFVPPEFAGKKVQCPQCSATFVVAGPSPDPLPPLTVQEARPYRAPDEDDADYYGDRFVRRDLLPHRGSTILTLGILSLLVCGPILGPMAWVMGNTDL